MQKTVIALMIFLPIFGIRSSTFFMPDSDTAALIAVVSNTASTVSNTLKILEVAKKTSNKIDHYNFLAMRRYFLARRVEQHIRDIVEVKKMRPKGLKEINQLLLRLKLNLSGLKSNIDFLAKDLFKAEDFIDRSYEKMNSSLNDEKETRKQELNSASEGNMSKHVQNTAINTALTSSILSKIRRDHIEYQNIDLSLKRSEGVEKLRREEFYKGWMGVSRKHEGEEWKTQ